jgi:hypothetical protein
MTRKFYVNADVHSKDEYSNISSMELALTGKPIEQSTGPQAPRTYYEDVESALNSESFLRQQAYLNPKCGMGPMEMVKVETPDVAMAYEMNVPSSVADTWEKPHKDTIESSQMSKIICEIGEDYLHGKQTVVAEVTEETREAAHNTVRQALWARAFALARLENSIERAFVDHRRVFNPNDENVKASLKTAFAQDGFVWGAEPQSMQEACMQAVGRTMSDRFDVIIMSHFNDVADIMQRELHTLDDKVPSVDDVMRAYTVAMQEIEQTLPPGARIAISSDIINQDISTAVYAAQDKWTDEHSQDGGDFEQESLDEYNAGDDAI